MILPPAYFPVFVLIIKESTRFSFHTNSSSIKGFFANNDLLDCLATFLFRFSSSKNVKNYDIDK